MEIGNYFLKTLFIINDKSCIFLLSAIKFYQKEILIL